MNITDIQNIIKVSRFKKSLMNSAKRAKISISEYKIILSIIKESIKTLSLSKPDYTDLDLATLVLSKYNTVPKKSKLDDEAFDILSKLPFEIKMPELLKIPTDPSANEDVSIVLSLQDLHFGKKGNSDLRENLLKVVNYFIHKAYKNYNVESVYLVIGPDTLNTDTFNGTTTKGTPVENYNTVFDMYKEAFEALSDVIYNLGLVSKKIKVIYIPGNHDRLSSFHLLHGLSKVFKTVEFDITSSDRKVELYGNNMLCFEHGDKSTKDDALVYAIEFPEIWGKSKYRYLYQGHVHSRKTIVFSTEKESKGFITKTLPSLSSNDYWGYHNKHIGIKSAIMMVHDKTKGLIAEITYNL